MRRLALFVAVCCALLAQSASANPPEAKRGPLGVVPSHNAAKRGGGSNLSYHGGPVMHTNATYAIYWDPAGYTMDRSYISTMNRYLGDVAAASGANSSSNVYWSDTQYYDGSGNIAFSSRFAGSYE